MSTPVITYELDGQIALIGLNRPDKRNAMSPALNKEMLGVLEDLELDERCGVIVLTGAGDAFTAGMDLKEYFRETDHLTPDERARIFRVNAQWQWRRLRFYPKPTIAMVNGPAAGSGMDMATQCDIRVGCENTRFITTCATAILPS